MKALLLVLFPVFALAQGYKHASSGAVTLHDVQAVSLGQNLSVNRLIVTQADPAQPSFILAGGRFLWAPTSVNNAYAYWDTSLGLAYSCGLALGPGQNFMADSIISRQMDRPTAINGAFGLQFVPVAAASLGQCGTVAAPEGTHKALSAASVSGPTRFCDCGSDGAGTPVYAWINTHCPVIPGTSTSCPACL
jgi:hypothetical protein